MTDKNSTLLNSHIRCRLESKRETAVALIQNGGCHGIGFKRASSTSVSPINKFLLDGAQSWLLL